MNSKDMKGEGRGLIKVLSRHVPEEAVQTKTNVKTVGELFDVRTEHLESARLRALQLYKPQSAYHSIFEPSTSQMHGLQRYRYTSLLGWFQ
jgi:hypothetical protein